MDKICELLLKLIDKFPKKKIIWLLVGIAFICGIAEVILPLVIENINYNDYFGVPGFIFREEGNLDMIMPDIGLGEGGEVIVSTYAVVKYDREMLCIVDVTNYYTKNYAYLNDDEEAGFALEVDDTQRKKRDDLTEKLKKLLNEDEALQDSFEVNIVHLAHISYRNVKRDYYEEAYWYFTNGVARKLCDYEVSFWSTKYVIDLDDYEVNGFVYNNQQLMDVVNSCKSFVNV